MPRRSSATPTPTAKPAKPRKNAKPGKNTPVEKRATRTAGNLRTPSADPHAANSAAEWFTDESLWQELFPVMFPAQRFQDARDQIEPLLKLLHLNGKKVLDQGCGPGRFSVPLANHGFEVTGVDRTQYLLDHARRYAKEAKAKVEWVHADMRDFVRPDTYDLALNLFTSFGYFETHEENMRALQNLFTSLRPGGVAVLDVVGKETLARGFQAVSYERDTDGLELIQRREVLNDWTRLRNEWLLIKNDRVRRWRFTLWIYSGQELRDMLRTVGFAEVRLVSDLSGAPYGPNAWRLIALGRKA